MTDLKKAFEKAGFKACREALKGMHLTDESGHGDLIDELFTPGFYEGSDWAFELFNEAAQALDEVASRATYAYTNTPKVPHEELGDLNDDLRDRLIGIIKCASNARKNLKAKLEQSE